MESIVKPMTVVAMGAVKSVLAAFFLLILSMAVATEGWGQVTDNVDPTVDQFPVVRGAGDPNYTGSLNISVPLMTVPGIRGLNYDISLQYIDGNGVPISQSSSWVGLGWNLQDYEITCNPVNGKIGTQYYWYDNQAEDPFPDAPQYVPDTYSLYYPGGSTQFWVDGNGNGTPVKWSAIKIQGIKDGSLTAKEYKCFLVYGIDGTVYVFADRLRKQAGSMELLNHDLQWQGHGAYYYVYKLSAILGPDYIDGGGESYLPGDGGTDQGPWIKLAYTSSPYTYYSNTNPSQAQEVDYLESISTSTYKATFVRSSIEDNPFVIDNLIANPTTLFSLDKIVLTRSDGTQQIREVDFFQTNVFEWLTSEGDGEYSWEPHGEGDPVQNLRMRLDSVRIKGLDDALSEPAYRFAYYDDDVDLSGHTPYYIDSWGYITSEYNNAYPQKYYKYGMLKDITYPTGGKAEFVYGPNYFQPNQYFSLIDLTPMRQDPTSAVMGGGLRLEQQIITDPQTGQQEIYTYQYGLTNNFMRQQYSAKGLSYPGVGFVSADPGPAGTQAPIPEIRCRRVVCWIWGAQGAVKYRIGKRDSEFRKEEVGFEDFGGNEG